jgi:hypothetical protein
MSLVPGRTRSSWLAFRVITSGGGASKSQLRWTVAGRPIYLGERKPAIPTCRDEVTYALQVVAAGGGGRSFTVDEVCALMAATGRSWPRATVAKTMLRMTRPARRPPYLQLDRVGTGQYRVGKWVPGVVPPPSRSRPEEQPSSGFQHPIARV